MILHGIRSSIRLRLLAVILTTTFVALFLSAIAVVLYDAQTYQRAWVNDLKTQAGIIARASAPALQFNDAATAADNLNLLKGREKIIAGAIYTASGERFAAYLHAGVPDAPLPDRPEQYDYQIDGNRISVYHPIMENGENLGTIYLHAQYQLAQRINDYLLLLTFAILGSMAVAALIASRLQRTITDPILDVTQVAREVMHSRNFGLRTPKSTNDEIGVLVEAFNGMLKEVEQRTNDLEAANRTLAQETVTRRHVEKELLQMDKRKDEFLAMLAHELRNPLAPISAAAQLLTLTRLDAHRTREISEVMIRQVEHMTSLIDDLLDVSRVTRGMITLERKPDEIHLILQEAVEQVRPLIEERSHKLEVAIGNGDMRVLGDRKRLVQVVTNLLNNAAKYTPEGGYIRLSAVADERDIEIQVSDNGIGIDAELLPHVFELFTQARRSSDRTMGGLGLGLALVKYLVELHGGSISVASAGPGRGSEFIVRLPQYDGELIESGPLPEASKTAGEPSTLNILLVDDNKDAALTMASCLEAAGHKVLCEYDSHRALETAAHAAPDLCLLDIGLPGMDGYELARRLRTLPATSNTLLIAITGYGQQKDKDMALEAGFDMHLVKPVDPKDLLELLAEYKPGSGSARFSMRE